MVHFTHRKSKPENILIKSECLDIDVENLWRIQKRWCKNAFWSCILATEKCFENKI